MECKKCGVEFTPKKGLKNYCSLKCRNSQVWTEEDKLKKSLAMKGRKPDLTWRENKKKVKDQIEKSNETKKQKLLKMEFSELKFNNLKTRLFYEQEGSCNKCGLDKWNDLPITLELEHKDGNHFNNKRSNVELLCPNCHSQTATWRGKNKQSNKNKVDDNELLTSLIENHWNIRQALINVGLAAKGGNYGRCHKLRINYFGS